MDQIRNQTDGCGCACGAVHFRLTVAVPVRDVPFTKDRANMAPEPLSLPGEVS